MDWIHHYCSAFQLSYDYNGMIEMDLNLLVGLYSQGHGAIFLHTLEGAHHGGACGE